MAFQLQVAANTPPPGSCYPSTWTAALAAIAQNLFVTGLGPLNSFNFGPTVPATDLQDRPWLKTNAQGVFLGVYTFTGGSWQPAAPAILPGTVDWLWAPDTSTIINPFYLCSGQTITGVGGSLVTPNLSGLTIIGAGTNPTTGTNFVNQAIVGEETHVLTQPELPNVVLTSTTLAYQSTPGAGLSGGGTVNTAPVSTPLGGQGLGHNTIQPSMAMWPVIFWP